MHKRAASLAVLVAALLASPAALATGWELWSGGDGEAILIAVCTPDAKNVFTAGAVMDSSGTLPTITPRVFASSDSGRTFADVSGPLAGLQYTTANAIAFLDDQRGWVGAGGSVYATSDRGASWSAAVSTGLDSVNALYFWDAQHGLAAGDASSAPAARLTLDGGKTWLPSHLPALSGSLDYLYFLDGSRGWAAGASSTSVDDGQGGSYDAPDQGFVLATTDGGKTWTASNLIAGYALGPVQFLRDGQTGWAAGYTQTDADHAVAALYKSTDGGKTFTDSQLPLDVGKISMMGFSGPLQTSFIRALFFADEKTGHLGGNAYVANTSDGQSSQPEKVYRTVDYWTADGTTWTRTDLGTLDLSSASQNDGMLAGATMLGVDTGWMVGEKASVWGYTAQAPTPCTGDDQCAPGFGCSPFGKCQSVACPDGCPAGQVCVWSMCRMPPDAGVEPGDDAGAPALDDAGQPIAVAGDGGAIVPAAGDGGAPKAGSDAGASRGSSSGCGCAVPGAAPSGAWLLLLSAWALSRRSRGHR